MISGKKMDLINQKRFTKMKGRDEIPTGADLELTSTLTLMNVGTYTNLSRIPHSPRLYKYSEKGHNASLGANIFHVAKLKPHMKQGSTLEKHSSGVTG